MRAPGITGSSQYTASVLLTRHELVHDGILEDVRRQQTLRQDEIMEGLLIEIVTQLQFGLSTQCLHLVLAVVIRRRLSRHAIGVALDFVLGPGFANPHVVYYQVLRFFGRY